MSVDLTLLPLIGPQVWVAHDILRLERRSELWPDVVALPHFDVPDAVKRHEARTPEGEACYGLVEFDCRGHGQFGLLPRPRAPGRFRNSSFSQLA